MLQEKGKFTRKLKTSCGQKAIMKRSELKSKARKQDNQNIFQITKSSETL